MILIFASLAALVGLWYLAKKSSDRSEWELVGMIGSILSACVLCFLLVSLPIARGSGRDRLVRLKAFRESVQRARENKNLSDIERASILTQISDWNEWLASERYWNGGMWDYWHVDEVETTEELR